MKYKKLKIVLFSILLFSFIVSCAAIKQKQGIASTQPTLQNQNNQNSVPISINSQIEELQAALFKLGQKIENNTGMFSGGGWISAVAVSGLMGVVGLIVIVSLRSNRQKFEDYQKSQTSEFLHVSDKLLEVIVSLTKKE